MVQRVDLGFGDSVRPCRRKIEAHLFFCVCPDAANRSNEDWMRDEKKTKSQLKIAAKVNDEKRNSESKFRRLYHTKSREIQLTRLSQKNVESRLWKRWIRDRIHNMKNIMTKWKSESRSKRIDTNKLIYMLIGKPKNGFGSWRKWFIKTFYKKIILQFKLFCMFQKKKKKKKEEKHIRKIEGVRSCHYNCLLKNLTKNKLS